MNSSVNTSDYGPTLLFAGLAKIDRYRIQKQKRTDRRSQLDCLVFSPFSLGDFRHCELSCIADLFLTWVKAQRAIVVGDGTRIVAPCGKDATAIIVCLRAFWVETQGFAQIGDGVFVIALFAEGQAAADQGVSVARVEAKRFAKGLDGANVIAASDEGVSTFVMNRHWTAFVEGKASAYFTRRGSGGAPEPSRIETAKHGE